MALILTILFYSRSLESPVKELCPLTDNAVICVRFRDPVYPVGFIFPAKRLPGAKEPERVLKPGDLTPEANRGWRPQVGMARSTTRASLGNAGHRMVNFHSRDGDRGGNDQQRSQGQYGAVPPPQNRNYGQGRILFLFIRQIKMV